MLGAGAVVPTFSSLSAAQEGPKKRPGRRTNGRSDVPAAIITGGRGQPVPEVAIRNKRKALLKRFDTADRAVLEDSIVEEGEHLLSYGIRLEDGVPIEYQYAVDSDISKEEFKIASERAHQKAKLFKRGEL